MNKKLSIVLILSALGLTGCVAVPYDAPYAYAPAPVVVQPSESFGYSSGYYYGGPRHRHYRHRY